MLFTAKNVEILGLARLKLVKTPALLNTVRTSLKQPTLQVFLRVFEKSIKVACSLHSACKFTSYLSLHFQKEV